LKSNDVAVFFFSALANINNFEGRKMKRIITTFATFLILAGLCLIPNLVGCKKKENPPAEQVVQKEVNQAPATNEKFVQFPALSEKDVKLIEEFIHEMNLLVELQRADSETFKYQLAKLDAAYSDLSDLGSDNDSMAIMRILAMDVSLSYSLAHTYWDSSRFEEYKKSRNDASQSRENFLEVYHMLVRGTTVLEVNKFLEDKVKNESTSK